MGAGVDFGSGVFGAAAVLLFAAGVLGVGDGLTAVLVLTGTGTKITPSGCIKGLPVFGSMV